MSTIERLLEKFPHLKLVKKPPSLFTYNGIGLTIYGGRDRDDESGTFVKTHCFSLVYLPIFALGAYRVAKAEGGGWYFIGKEPLSKLAKGWNILILLALLSTVVSFRLQAHWNSPEYLSEKQLTIANEEVAKKQYLAAAKKFLVISRQYPVAAQTATTGMNLALDTGLASGISPTELAEYVNFYATLPKPIQETSRTTKLVDQALTTAREAMATDPKASATIATALLVLDPKNSDYRALKIQALEARLAANPTDVESAIALALEFEKDDDKAKIRAVLYPVRDQLGHTEGARILASILMSEGKPAEAYPLLSAYVGKRLAELHNVEAAYRAAAERAEKRALESLQSGTAEPSFYTSVDAANETDRARLIGDRLRTMVEGDATYNAALGKLQTMNQIVPVALELGIAQVDRAQSAATPEDRKKEFEAAESTFLAIRSFAEESDEYQLFLGEVYFWLGKFDQGNALFDQLLERNQRAPELMVNLGRTLRAVGLDAEARAMAEEAAAKATKDETRQGAAMLRSLLPTSVEDRIEWLKKCDQSSPEVQASLNSGLADLALQNGDTVAAEQALRKAIQANDALSKTSASLNNQGLNYIQLFSIAGKQEDLNTALSLFDAAILLDPSSSILLSNAASILMSTAILQITKNSLRYDLLSLTPSFATLSYCIDTPAQRDALIAAFKADPLAIKGITFLEKAMSLRPKDPTLYSRACSLYTFCEDLVALEKLDEKLSRIQPDLTDENKGQLDAYSGKDDAEARKSIATHQKELQRFAANPQVRSSPASSDYVLSSLAAIPISLYSLGDTVDVAAMVTEAEKFLAARPNRIARGVLANALFFRAHERLIATNPDYAKIAAATRRSCPPSRLLLFTVNHSGPGADAAAKDPDVIKAVGLLEADGLTFPKQVDSAEWAMSLRVMPEKTGQIRELALANRVALASHAIELRLSPVSVQTVLISIADSELCDQPAQARAIYTAATAAGAPLPPWE